jgi:Sulfotransferase family
MLISHNHKFIFLRPRKVASTTIEVYFERYCLPAKLLIDYIPRHKRGLCITPAGIITSRAAESPEEARTVVAEDFVKHTKHNQAYNKWTKNLSRHLHAEKVKTRIGDLKWNNYFKFSAVRNPYTRAVSWYYFINSLKKHKTTKVTADLNTEKENFSNWVTSEDCTKFFEYEKQILTIDNEYCYDDVIRFEDLQNEIVRISNKLKLPVDINYIKHFKSNKAPFTADLLYTDTAKQVILDHTGDYMSRFGYTFPTSNK